MYSHHERPGAAEDFHELYAQYHARLVRFCGRRLGGTADAEDAAHEALLRAFQAWSRFDPTTDAWPWLATIAARVCADARRRAARPVIDPGHPTGVEVHDQAVSRMRASIVEAALNRLPARYRNPLILKEFAGWSYRDIAELQGRSVASVRSTIMRSRRHLSARVEAVARSQGQWPLPAVVPRVAERARVQGRRTQTARAWAERLAQAAGALFDSSTGLAGGVVSPAVQAVGSTAVIALAALSPLAPQAAAAVPSTAPPPPAASSPPVTVHVAPPGGGASLAAEVDPPSAPRLPRVKTILRIEDHVPDNPVIGIGVIEVKAEHRSDRTVFTVSNLWTLPVFDGDRNAATLQVSCHRHPAVCPTVQQAVEAVAED